MVYEVRVRYGIFLFGLREGVWRAFYLICGTDGLSAQRQYELVTGPNDEVRLL
jgi:hypothetical protein